MFVIFDTQFLSMYIPLIQFYGKRRQWKYETFIFSSFSDIHVHLNFGPKNLQANLMTPVIWGDVTLL